MSTNPQDGSRPTVVLVHGAFADVSSWNERDRAAAGQGYTVIGPRKSSTQHLGRSESTSPASSSRSSGPVLAGRPLLRRPVITNAAANANNVKALVYVAAFAPDEGESPWELSDALPGHTLWRDLDSASSSPTGEGHRPLHPPGRIPSAVRSRRCPPSRAALMAVTQRPLRDVVLTRPRELRPGSRSHPGSCSRARQRYPLMRPLHGRAGGGSRSWRSRASHAVGVSHPELADIILRALKDVE